MTSIVLQLVKTDENLSDSQIYQILQSLLQILSSTET